MKTTHIMKALAMAMLMPAMLFTACSKDKEVTPTIDDDTVKDGYELQVTVNVTCENDNTPAGSSKTMRAEYNGESNKLEFSTGDKLFVMGSQASAGSFAGTLDWVSDGNFSGTITTKNEYTGTADALLSGASSASATLLPAGYGSYGYLTIKNSGYNAYIETAQDYAFATTKAAGVEQLSLEKAATYSNGFALSPENAILNFTITGLTPNSGVTATLKVEVMSDFINLVSGSVTTNAAGEAIFAMGVTGDTYDIQYLSLSIGGNTIDITNSSITLVAGKIYNITRSAAPAATDLSSIDANYTASNGETLTGTLEANVQISIADGATVTLNNVSINASGTWTSGNYAGITCEGDATIILSGTNTVKGFYDDYPGIYVPVGNTVTIKGSGSLTASSNFGAGIGGGFGISCGNIEIQGGVITAIGGLYAAGIGAGSGVTGVGGESICGTITISGGTVTAIGGGYAAGIGSGFSPSNPSTCGAISISGGTVSATAGALAPAAIGKGAVDVGESTCASVTITPGITSLTLTNTNEDATGIVSDFINATAVNANTTPITTMLSTSVTDSAITGGMATAGFATSYNGGTKTWTITK